MALLIVREFRQRVELDAAIGHRVDAADDVAHLGQDLLCPADGVLDGARPNTCLLRGVIVKRRFCVLPNLAASVLIAPVAAGARLRMQQLVNALARQ